MLKPGTYKLTRDLLNPSADRRHKRDWREFEFWREGWEFLVQDRESGGHPYTQIVLVGHRWTHQAIGPGHKEKYAALEAALVPCAESNEAMFTALGVDDHFARFLVRSGKLDEDAFRKLWAEYQDDAPVLTPDGWRIGALLPQLTREGAGAGGPVTRPQGDRAVAQTADRAADRAAVGIYAVMARDPSDAIEMIHECDSARTLDTLLGMLKGEGGASTDRELNALFVGPVERRRQALGLPQSGNTAGRGE